MKIIVTGSCGFIGFHVTKKLLDLNYNVIGIDNINNYYDIKLKKDRLKILKTYKKFFFHKTSIEQIIPLKKIFKKYKPEIVVNLAAQAGVRYSILKPFSYIKSNLVGFFNVLSLSKDHKIKNFVYASSSSVYGANKIIPLLKKTS